MLIYGDNTGWYNSIILVIRSGLINTNSFIYFLISVKFERHQNPEINRDILLELIQIEITYKTAPIESKYLIVFVEV